MLRLPAVLAALVSSALTLAAGNAWGFEISPAHTLIPVPHPHIGDKGIHEDITHLAILIAHREERAFTPSRAFIKDVQAGTENADITRQFDSEQHFDNATVTNGGFELSFGLVQGHFAAVVKLAKGNDEFRDPSFTTFQDIAGEVESILLGLVHSPKCVLRRGSARRRSSSPAAGRSAFSTPCSP